MPERPARLKAMSLPSARGGRWVVRLFCSELVMQCAVLGGGDGFVDGGAQSAEDRRAGEIAELPDPIEALTASY